MAGATDRSLHQERHKQNREASAPIEFETFPGSIGTILGRGESYAEKRQGYVNGFFGAICGFSCERRTAGLRSAANTLHIHPNLSGPRSRQETVGKAGKRICRKIAFRAAEHV